MNSSLMWMRRGRRWLDSATVFLLVWLTACGSLITPPAPKPTMTPDAVSGAGLATSTIAPESYLTPIPPTPTFTPSPTPTPVVHIVKQGDTLFGVALEYGVTVDGLMRVNALSEADYLRIGQSLVIPVEEDEATGMGGGQAPVGHMILPTPTPLPLTTANVALYQTPVGGVWAMGEVVNTTDGPVTNLQVEVTLVTDDGTPLATAQTLAAADYLPSQARAPFSILFRDPPDGVADAEVRLLRGETVSAITARFVPLRVVAAEGDVSGPQYRVRGDVVNGSDRSVTRISVVATIYNKQGNVVGYRQLMMGDDVVIAPGQQHAFDVLITPQEVTAPTDFTVVAWGYAS